MVRLAVPKSLRHLPRTVVALGVVSFLTDLSSEMIYPLLPVFLVDVLGAGAIALGTIEGVAESTAAMTDAKSHVETIAQHLLQSSKRAQAIGEITRTVDDIAEQTNVLALNAAIEASRAGEHGKGFSVVAAEVKTLARQSQDATSRVRSILGDIQKATSTTALATEQGTQAVTTTAAILDKAGATIEQLANTIAAAARAASQISASASQQASSTAQLREGMSGINRIARDNLAAIQQIESAAEDLNALTHELAALTK